jgi:hypothetical protein
MHPTIAVGVAVLAWLFVHRWSSLARMLLAVAAIMLGWEPATRGDRLGFVLVSAACGIAVSVLLEELVGIRRSAVAPADVRQQQPLVAARPPGAPPTPVPPVDLTSDGFMPWKPAPAPPLVPPPAEEPLTELERAEWYSDLLDVNIAGLEEAKRNGDLRAQAAFAGEIEDLASDMREMLRVVLGDRHRINN